MSSAPVICRSAARQRYAAEGRRLVHKRRRVLRSSHGRWEYEALVAYGKEMQRLAEERKRAAEAAALAAGREMIAKALERRRVA